MMNREECLRVLHQFRQPSTVVVTTMGSVAPWSQLSNTALDFPAAGSAMAHAADFAMGIALAQPNRQVWVLNGDGSMLMSLGTLVTICQTPPTNLVLFVLQNNTYEVTGNQPIPGADRISMVQMAQAAGFIDAYEFLKPQDMLNQLPAVLALAGPLFVNLHVKPGREAPPKLDCPLRDPALQLRNAVLQPPRRGE